MNKRKMLSAIADVKRATRIAVRDMPITDQIYFYREMSDWATCNEQIAAFHPSIINKDDKRTTTPTRPTPLLRAGRKTPRVEGGEAEK